MEEDANATAYIQANKVIIDFASVEDLQKLQTVGK
jgi:hypothetical protein